MKTARDTVCESIQQLKVTLEQREMLFRRDIIVLAERVRTEAIIPICERHKLHFISCCGTWHFEPAGTPVLPDIAWHADHVTTVLGAKEKHLEFLIPILEMLDTDILQFTKFGWFITSYSCSGE